ncbi:unnamed protein product [Musa acuminata subsp. burmannicoides]
MSLVHQCGDGRNLIIMNHVSEAAPVARTNMALSCRAPKSQSWVACVKYYSSVHAPPSNCVDGTIDSPVSPPSSVEALLSKSLLLLVGLKIILNAFSSCTQHMSKIKHLWMSIYLYGEQCKVVPHLYDFIPCPISKSKERIVFSIFFHSPISIPNRTIHVRPLFYCIDFKAMKFILVQSNQLNHRYQAPSRDFPDFLNPNTHDFAVEISSLLSLLSTADATIAAPCYYRYSAATIIALEYYGLFCTCGLLYLCGNQDFTAKCGYKNLGLMRLIVQVTFYRCTEIAPRFAYRICIVFRLALYRRDRYRSGTPVYRAVHPSVSIVALLQCCTLIVIAVHDRQLSDSDASPYRALYPELEVLGRHQHPN